MTQSAIRVTTCDRCGAVGEHRRAEDEYAWAALNYSEINGHRWIGTKREDKPQWADLCPPCSKELFDWFAAGKARP